MFNIDISTCDACGGAVRVIASIEHPVVIPTTLAALAGQALKQILAHLQRKAESNAMKGVFSHCLTLDPQADQYVSRIFGENHYSIVDNIERLPERLPNVFAALTG